MKWLAATTAALSVGHLVLVAPAGHAEVVETPAAMVSSAQVSIAMDNDWQFLDGDCLFIPILATYGRADDTSIVGELTVTKPSDPTIANEGTFLVLPGDPVSSQVLDEVFVCPADGTGEYRLATLIRAVEPTTEQVFSLDPLTFWVRPATSRMTKLSSVDVKGGIRVTGEVKAGRSEATGIVDITVQRPGSRKWILTEHVAVESGAFSVVIPETLPRGTRIKATLTECSWCSRVSDTTRVR